MKKILSIIISAVMLATMLSVGVTASAKTSVSAAKIKLANVSKGVKITWNKAKGAKKYELARKAQGAKKYSVIKKFSNAKAKSFTDKKVKAGKKYTYALKAINGGASASSDSKSIIRLKAPTNVKVKSVAEEFEVYIKITWSKAKGAKSYKIYRSVYDGKKFGKYKLYEETNSKVYYLYYSSKLCRYKVAACSGSSVSAMSAASSKIAVLDDVYVSLEMNKDYTGVHVAWEEEKGATGFEIYRSTGDNKNYSLLKKSTKFSTEKDEFGDIEYYYDDKDITYNEHYYYYVRAYNKYTKSKGKIKDLEESIRCREYDLLIETGEENASDILSCALNYYKDLGEMKITLTSEDESILKIKTETDTEGVQKTYMVGVKPGDTYINLKSEYPLLEMTDTKRFKIRVQNEPVYGVELKVGESSSPFSEIDTLGMDEWATVKDALKASATSEDESIVKVEGSDLDLKLTGVSAGITKVRFKMSMKIGAVSIDLMDYTFKVLVTE